MRDLNKRAKKKMGEEIDVGLLASTPSGRFASKTPAGVLFLGLRLMPTLSPNCAKTCSR